MPGKSFFGLVQLNRTSLPIFFSMPPSRPGQIPGEVMYPAWAPPLLRDEQPRRRT
jgi:hypothetical protein